MLVHRTCRDFAWNHMQHRYWLAYEQHGGPYFVLPYLPPLAEYAWVVSKRSRASRPCILCRNKNYNSETGVRRVNRSRARLPNSGFFMILYWIFITYETHLSLTVAFLPLYKQVNLLKFLLLGNMGKCFVEASWNFIVIKLHLTIIIVWFSEIAKKYGIEN